MRRDPDAFFAKKPKKEVPFEFVLDELAELDPTTRPMFGCTSIYIGERIVFILRDKGDKDNDSGVWIATEFEHHPSLRKEFPGLRSIEIFGPGESAWQILSKDLRNFEPLVLKACKLALAGDPRIGRVPKAKRPKAMKTKAPTKKTTAAKKALTKKK